MRTLQIQLPDEVQIPENDILMILTSKLYENGTLSSGQAAMFAGVSKRTFLEQLGKYGVSVFSSSVEDLKSNIANA